MFRKKFTDVQDACALAHAIVDTVREPIIPDTPTCPRAARPAADRTAWISVRAPRVRQAALSRCRQRALGRALSPRLNAARARRAGIC